jgi:hypothetical protein
VLDEESSEILDLARYGADPVERLENRSEGEPFSGFSDRAGGSTDVAAIAYPRRFLLAFLTES